MKSLKRLVKLLLSLVVRAVDVVSQTAGRLAGSKCKPRCVVLYYHAVPAAQRTRFALQMDELVRLAIPIRADHRTPLQPGRLHGAVTFDDGFVSVLSNAVPELEQRQIPFTIFVPTGSLGGPPAWIKDPTMPARHEVVMSADQLAALKAHPLVTIGSHSISHPNFLALEETEARRELQVSKAVLEAALDRKVGLFSFPHGKCNDRLVRECRACGYERVFTIDPACALDPADEFVTGRVLVDPEDWPIEFRLKLLGAYRWMARA